MNDVESAETYRSLLATIRAFLVELDEKGRVLYASPSIEEIIGYTPEEYVGRFGFEIVHEDERDDLFERFRDLMQTGKAGGVIFRDRHKDGHPVWLVATGRVHVGTDGGRRIVSIVRDVSDLEQARAALRESEERFRVMAEKAPDLIAELSEDGRVLFVGARARDFLGIEPDAVMGCALGQTPITERYHREDRERFVAAIRSGATEEGARFELRYEHPDGSTRWHDITVTTYRTRTGERRAVLVTRDATERVLAEQRLRQSEERYRVVAEATRDLITEQDVDGRVTYASPSCEAVLGYSAEELRALDAMRSLVHPDDLPRVMESFRGCAESRYLRFFLEPYRMWRRDGSLRWFEGAGISYHKADGSLSVLGVTRDVTERIEAEEQRRALEQRVQQAQRLEGLGIMAGGIAHDFNNLLTPILGEAGLALLALPPDSPLRRHLENIQKAAQRAAALTAQMLAYAGQRPLAREALDLSALARELGELMASTAGRRTRIVYALADGLPTVEGDASQLGQVAMNLITNAAEALGEAGGMVWIRTGVASGAPEGAAQRLGAELGSGAHVFLEVEDGGCGMDAATRARIFDPFFTTKFTGRGLGLAAVLGIVRAHRGAIEIESAPGRGSRFRVLLPAAAGERGAEAARPAADAGWRGEGTVLVVDDDEGVRAFAVAVLERCGLRVLTASSGNEAIELYARRAPEIAAVVLDHTLPGTGGEEVFAAIRRVRPDAAVVLVSGYGEERVAGAFGERSLAAFLRKPFTPEALIDAVRKAFG